MKRWYTYLFAGCCAVALGACTGNFRDLNDDRSGITDKELEADNNGLGYRLGIIFDILPISEYRKPVITWILPT